MKIPITLIPQGRILRDPNLTFRMQRSNPTVETVTRVEHGMAIGAILFHDAYNGIGTLSGRVADTGQIWSSDIWSPINCIVGGGKVTSVEGLDAIARAILGPYDLKNFDWTTVVSATSDGSGSSPPDANSVGGDLLGPDMGQIGFAAKPFDADLGGPSLLVNWNDGTLAGFQTLPIGGFDLDVEHTLLIQIRGDAINTFWDGTPVHTKTGAAVFAALGQILVGLTAVVSNGYTFSIHDSLVVYPGP